MNCKRGQALKCSQIQVRFSFVTILRVTEAMKKESVKCEIIIVVMVIVVTVVVIFQAGDQVIFIHSSSLYDLHPEYHMW